MPLHMKHVHEEYLGLVEHHSHGVLLWSWNGKYRGIIFDEHGGVSAQRERPTCSFSAASIVGAL